MPRTEPTPPSRRRALPTACVLMLALAVPAAAQSPRPRPPQDILSCAAEAGRKSALAVQDPASRGWRVTTRENIVVAANGDWSIPCPPPPPVEGFTADAALHRLCRIDAAILACLQDRHGWRKGKGKTAGLVFPPG
jgi:hypothetical protein